jgi:hypothetical protein
VFAYVAATAANRSNSPTRSSAQRIVSASPGGLAVAGARVGAPLQGELPSDDPQRSARATSSLWMSAASAAVPRRRRADAGQRASQLRQDAGERGVHLPQRGGFGSPPADNGLAGAPMPMSCVPEAAGDHAPARPIVVRERNETILMVYLRPNMIFIDT